MGLGQSTIYLSEADLSDEDIDEAFVMAGPNGLALDAVKKPAPVFTEDLLSFKKLSSIEEKLDEYEMISLIYLLYEESHLALEALNKYTKSGKREATLYHWVHSDDVTNRKKQRKLIEALCIIQNYQILTELGYSKHELQVTYKPHQFEVSFEVNKMRKIFYLIAEKLTKEQTLTFIKALKKKSKELNVICPEYDDDYLEFYFLHWEQSKTGFKSIRQALKIVDAESLYDKLDYIKPLDWPNNNEALQVVQSEPISNNKARQTTTTKDNTTYLTLMASSSEDTSFNPVPTSIVLQENSLLDTNRYQIDSNNPGVVLIINQEMFYTEPEEKYKHLLHECNDEIQLTPRDGTHLDRDRLKSVFIRMGFKVVVQENMPHYKMLEAIENVTDEVSTESSLIICILSHGDKGVVYGSNSCKVNVSKIQYVMCKKNKKLAGKPKVLILQSCQGQICQKIDEEDEDCYAVDGPTRANPIVDLLTFWATIPGFAAVRNKNRGSWFIQALCDEIEKGNSQLHFSDICTRAVKTVTNQEWKEKSITNVMTPLVETTLTQSFYLPRFRT